MGNSIDSLQPTIIYSSRKSIAIELKMDAIIVRAPRRMLKRDIYAFLEEKRPWIEKNLVKIQARKDALKNFEPFTVDEIKDLTKKAAIVIPEKVKKYARIIGVDYGRISIRHQRTRWGSCSSKGNLNFNCMLMLFPDEVIDYVVVHELCHRKHMNHSERFYKEVEGAYPEYRKWRKWLKENGGLYLSRLP